jgi:hypothetical protein
MTPPSRPRNERFGLVVDPRCPPNRAVFVTPATNAESARFAMLRFEGGPVDTSAFPAAHPGETPTTIGPGALLDSCASDALKHIKDALALAERGHIAEARFEFSQANMAINEAIGYCK